MNLDDNQLTLVVFVILFILFLPFIAQAVRTALLTWDNRESVPKERKREVFLVTPTMIIVAFLLINWLVLVVINILRQSI